MPPTLVVEGEGRTPAPIFFLGDLEIALVA